VKDPLVDLQPPLTAMTARPVPQLPDKQHSAQLMFEPKLDGPVSGMCSILEPHR
jgi:hypothetical protein